MSPRLEYLSAVQEQHTGKPSAEKDADRTRAQRVGRKNSSCFTYRHCPCLRSGEASSVAWELGSRALLLANEAPCPTADYQFLLAHRAYFMHCLQETPPGNLYLQGWQTAISSITGWLRETEPIKWILESTEVFTSVLSKREKKKITAMWSVLHISGKKCICYAEHSALPKDARTNMSRERHR